MGFFSPQRGREGGEEVERQKEHQTKYMRAGERMEDGGNEEYWRGREKK